LTEFFFVALTTAAASTPCGINENGYNEMGKLARTFESVHESNTLYSRISPTPPHQVSNHSLRPKTPIIILLYCGWVWLTLLLRRLRPEDMDRVFIRRVQIRLGCGDRDLDFVLVLARGDNAEVGADLVVALSTPGYVADKGGKKWKGNRRGSGRTGR
jgi:hypothetical protein